MGGLRATIASIPPLNDLLGDVWIDDTTGIEYVYVDDGVFTGWVEFANNGYFGPTGPSSVNVNSVYDNANPNVSVQSVTNINFLESSGFIVTQDPMVTSNATVGLKGTFGTLKIGDANVAASGQDTLNILAGTGITLTSNVNASPKTFTISSKASVLGVNSATKVDTFSTTALSTYSDIPGLQVGMQVASGSNVMVHYTVAVAATDNASIQITRNNKAVFVGAAAGTRFSASAGSVGTKTADQVTVVSGSFVDNPKTTGPIVYSVQIRADGSGVAYVNRSVNYTDGTAYSTSASSLTAMEIIGNVTVTGTPPALAMQPLILQLQYNTGA
jgi:hypothetical protein